jgi:hypothetical protein
MDKSSFFQKGYGDTNDPKDSKKASRLAFANSYKRATGKPQTTKKEEEATEYKVPCGHIQQQLNSLRNQGRMTTAKADNRESAANDARDDVRKAHFNHGAMISLKTITAAASGYYMVDGEYVYMHTDGTIARLDTANMHQYKQKCVCNMTHG